VINQSPLLLKFHKRWGIALMSIPIGLWWSGHRGNRFTTCTAGSKDRPRSMRYKPSSAVGSSSGHSQIDNTRGHSSDAGSRCRHLLRGTHSDKLKHR